LFVPVFSRFAYRDKVVGVFVPFFVPLQPMGPPQPAAAPAMI
jgi:hypothetical protein